MNDTNIKRASLSEIKRMREAGELHHNPDAPTGESLGHKFWVKGQKKSNTKNPPHPGPISCKEWIEIENDKE